jgi:hypothetical protein
MKICVIALLCSQVALADPGELAAPQVQSTVAAREGAYSAAALAPVRERRGLIVMSMGYDQPRNAPILSALAQLALTARVSVRAGIERSDVDDATTSAVLQFDALAQRDAGIDVAFAAGYEGLGFNTVPAAVARVGLGRQLGALRISSVASYGAGLEEGERYGSLYSACSYQLGTRTVAGLEAVGGLDLERDDDEPADEPDWQLRAGPMLAYAFDAFALTANIGWSTTKYRLSALQRTGVVGTVGVGRTF